MVELGMVVHAKIPSLGMQRQEDPEFQVSWGFKVGSKPAWDRKQNPVSKTNKKLLF
jgi:hypothetical protein